MAAPDENEKSTSSARNSLAIRKIKLQYVYSTLHLLALRANFICCGEIAHESVKLKFCVIELVSTYYIMLKFVEKVG